VGAVFFVKRKSLPDKQRGGNYSKPDTDSLRNTTHIHHHKKDDDAEQPTGKDEQVLAFQPLKLDWLVYAFIDCEFCHNLEEK
jgi:hypothetical protein